MPGAGAQLKRALIFVHRWMGVLFRLLFLSWFASGIVMMSWQYPEVTPADRLRHAPALDATQIHLPPALAYARLELDSPPVAARLVPPAAARLVTYDGRPAYRFRFGLDDVATGYSANRKTQDEFPPTLPLCVDSAWRNKP